MTPVSFVKATESYEVLLVTISRQTRITPVTCIKTTEPYKFFLMNHTRFADWVTSRAVHLTDWNETGGPNYRIVWLVGWLWFNGPLRQYFSLYRAVCQRGRKKREMMARDKMSKQPPPAHTASAVGPCPPPLSKFVGRPGTGSLPSTFAPPDHTLPHRTDCVGRA